jgi:exodeoxyribonuclease VII large subunit
MMFDSDEDSPNSTLQTQNSELVYAPSDFGRIVVEGELTNMRVSKGRWLYFDLKDADASLKCFGTVYMLPGPLEDGMLVRVVASPRLHPQFGFSLTIESITPSGEGALVKAAALLRAKLESEGLFDPARKRRLPYPPDKIALVASSESAAYADFTKIMRARWPLAEIMVHETQVQGEAAPMQIVAAIESANAQADLCDVLVVIRGGGSADDLAAFSDERVVRAVSSSRIPTMVAIGHEIDESLAELAADARASTPSNAAELIAPDMANELELIKSLQSELTTHIRSLTHGARRHIEQVRMRLLELTEQLVTSELRSLVSIRQLLDAYNPQAVLTRGYTLVRKAGKLAKPDDIHVGDSVEIDFGVVKRQAEITS